MNQRWILLLLLYLGVTVGVARVVDEAALVAPHGAVHNDFLVHSELREKGADWRGFLGSLCSSGPSVLRETIS